MLPERKPHDGARKRIVVVARLVTEKKLAAALGALSSDKRLLEEVHLTVVGDGPERAALEALAVERGLTREFLGALPRAQVGAVIGGADALLLPSTKEPWGIVVCEALGLGVPVIATPAVGAAVSLPGYTRGRAERGHERS